MIAWPSGVNTTVLDETTGSFGEGVIGDKMRSGKKKTRPIGTVVPGTLNVVMTFTRTEFELFKDWYNNDLRCGALSFQFPKIAGTGYAEYRTAEPRWAQFGASTVKVSMLWEEV